jgi:type IV pilus assembly protein PilX
MKRPTDAAWTVAPRPAPASARVQGGLALVCSLMLLVAAMVIGVAVARGAFALMASARNEDDRITARAAAEAALRDAEHDIAGVAAGAAGGAEPARAAQFAPSGGGGFADGCGSGSADLGLCKTTAPAAWERIDLAADFEVIVPYGRYTGAAFPLGAAGASARSPGYLIEQLEPAGAAPALGNFYRITAIGFGTRTTTQVVLQAIYRKPGPVAPTEGTAGDPAAGDPAAGAGAEPRESDASPDATGDTDEATPHGPGTDGAAGPGPPSAAVPPPTLRAGRIGWREFANWPELHARASQ